MNKRVTKLIACTLIASLIILLNPVKSNAAWKQNSTGWWFTEGSSWATGWRLMDGKWYYFRSNGYMATGWVKSGAHWYYLNSDGSMATGWKQVGSKWYYLYSNGSMATGWIKSSSRWYYLNYDGSMAENTWVEGIYYVGNNGAMIETEEYKHLFGQTDIEGGQMNERIIVARIDDNKLSVKYIYSGYNEGLAYDGYLTKVSGNTYSGKLKYWSETSGYTQLFSVEVIDEALKIVKSPIGISDGAIANKVK